MEIVSRPVGIQQGTRLHPAVLIENRQRDVSHVGCGRVSHHQQLHDGDENDQHQRTRVAYDLDELLTNNRLQTDIDHVLSLFTLLEEKGVVEQLSKT